MYINVKRNNLRIIREFCAMILEVNVRKHCCHLHTPNCQRANMFHFIAYIM